jgi:hypothetical protein
MIMDDMKCHAYDCNANACVTPGCYTQEVPEAEEPGKELPECIDHQPSSFERGKPWSIIGVDISNKITNKVGQTLPQQRH